MVVKERKLIFKGNKISVIVEEILGRRGIYKAEIVEHPGAVVILPLKNDKIIMVKQHRPAIRGVLLELPAGTLEPGENPYSCAMRELEEETGYKAGRLELLGSFYASPGYSSEKLYAFLAEKLTQGEKKPEIDEDISVLEIEEDRVLEMVKRGEIEDSKTLSTLFLFYTKKKFS
ncbi:MAG: hypothetical protein DRJ37_02495 [Thermoprotei archaeon]|nr:MAG: hypothetical protein DRJ37_02495 [Thermoprotei archaeon]